MNAKGGLMFHRLAPFYDRIVTEKDYRSESERLMMLARKYGRSGGHAWLDVACGTGGHLAHFRQEYSVCGIDVSSDMLRVARRRLPDVPLVRGDMRRFRLHQSFDVVSCLFSAVGHLRNEGELRATFDTFARHLKPGGVALVEPWIQPAEYHPGMLHLMTYNDPSVKLVRLAHSTRRGNHSVVHVHYLVGERHQGIRHFEETDVGLMVSRERLLSLFRESGFEPRFLAHGARPGRGLVVGVRRARTPATGGGNRMGQRSRALASADQTSSRAKSTAR